MPQERSKQDADFSPPALPSDVAARGPSRAAPPDVPLSPDDLLRDEPQPAPDDEIEDAPIETRVPTDATFPCDRCGADLRFKPGLGSLRCEYCGKVNEIPQSEQEIAELDLAAYLDTDEEHHDTEEHAVIACQTCGAQPEIDPSITSTECPFCGSSIVRQGATRRVIKPRALLPFVVDRRLGRQLFRKWLKKLWFAPNRLKKAATIDQRLKGVYVPHWTFDSSTITYYKGRRGTTRSTGFGKNRRTYTSWRNISGVITHSFDDVLVRASGSLPREHADELEPWDLQNLVPYEDAYLAGFTAEAYSLDLKGGFRVATGVMDEHLRRMVKRDIGGDEQQIVSMRTQHRAVTFKHILLPVWISAYRFHGKTYRFLINARTGEVRGERPYSAWKITLAALVGVLVGVVVWWYINHSGMVSSGASGVP